jgi:hypothetical protein
VDTADDVYMHLRLYTLLIIFSFVLIALILTATTTTTTNDTSEVIFPAIRPHVPPPAWVHGDGTKRNHKLANYYF